MLRITAPLAGLEMRLREGIGRANTLRQRPGKPFASVASGSLIERQAPQHLPFRRLVRRGDGSGAFMNVCVLNAAGCRTMRQHIPDAPPIAIRRIGFGRDETG
jgi:hypothetical protein